MCLTIAIAKADWAKECDFMFRDPHLATQHAACVEFTSVIPAAVICNRSRCKGLTCYSASLPSFGIHTLTGNLMVDVKIKHVHLELQNMSPALARNNITFRLPYYSSTTRETMLVAAAFFN